MTITLGVSIANMNLAYQFSIVTHEEVRLQSDITDHLVEDNTYVQDHIALKPIVYTLRGLVGEKIYKSEAQSKIAQKLREYNSKLTPLKVFAPTLTSYAQSAINAYEAVEKRIVKLKNNIETAYNTIQALGGKKATISKENQQLKALKVLNYLRLNRLPVYLETGWDWEIKENFNFYITDVAMTQEDTYHKSELVVTIKQLRFTSVNARPATLEDYKNVVKDQEAAKIIQTTQGEETASQLWKEYHGET